MKKSNLIIHRISTYSLLFFILSFGGWILETLTFFLLYENYYDRGFLSLPLCPIYGTTLLVIYFICGTPFKPRTILKPIKSKMLLFFLYFSFSFILPTLSEYIVGYYFDHYKNIMLWDYSHMPFNINGYICLIYSLIWAIMIMLFMTFAFPYLKKYVNLIPTKIGIFISILFYFSMLTDFIINIT